MTRRIVSIRTRPAKTAIIGGVLAVAAAVSGCQSLAPPDAGTSAKRIDDALGVIADPTAPSRKVKAAETAYRRTLARMLPAALDGRARPDFEAAAADPPARPDPDTFTELTPVDSPRIRTPGLHRAGLGAPVVGRIYPGGPNAPRAGYHTAVTAVALPAAKTRLRVGLADPELVETVGVGTRWVPLAMDLEAPLDATRALGPGIFGGLKYLLRADTFSGEARVGFLQPYDPAKRPLVLIHGLMTTPRMWDRLVRELLADPCIRAEYQIRFFNYPTAQPVPLSALQLRNALDDAVAWHNVQQPMVLVGYSMGGVLARAQVSSLTLDQAEGILPGVSALPEDHLARQALVFEPRPDVSRVVFMFTPHRGSRLATLNLAVWGTRLIRLPDWVRNEMSDVVNSVRGLPRGRLPTSIHGLSPRSPFLAELDRRPPVAPAHTILGNRGRRRPLSQSSDGVVPYSSAHLRAAVSEVVVPTGHGGFDHPQSIAELKRILRLDLATQSRGQRVAPSCARPSLGEG